MMEILKIGDSVFSAYYLSEHKIISSELRDNKEIYYKITGSCRIIRFIKEENLYASKHENDPFIDIFYAFFKEKKEALNMKLTYLNAIKYKLKKQYLKELFEIKDEIYRVDKQIEEI